MYYILVYNIVMGKVNMLPFDLYVISAIIDAKSTILYTCTRVGLI